MEITIDISNILNTITVDLIHTRAMIETLVEIQLTEEQKTEFRKRYEERVKLAAEKAAEKQKNSEDQE